MHIVSLSLIVWLAFVQYRTCTRSDYQ